MESWRGWDGSKNLKKESKSQAFLQSATFVKEIGKLAKYFESKGFYASRLEDFFNDYAGPHSEPTLPLDFRKVKNDRAQQLWDHFDYIERGAARLKSLLEERMPEIEAGDDDEMFVAADAEKPRKPNLTLVDDDE